MKNGFTLVEIMIIVFIVGILAAIAVPSFIKAKKESEAKRLAEDSLILEKGTEVLPVKAEPKIIINAISEFDNFTVYRVFDKEYNKSMYLVKAHGSVPITIAQ